MNQLFCSLPKTQEKILSPGISASRAEFIISTSRKWVNGTKLRYFFFDNENDGSILKSTGEFVTWKGTEAQKDVVRTAFATWKSLGIGLQFEEVTHKEDAQIRIGFMMGDGSWSYIGRDILNQHVSARTMNFGWDISVPDQANGIGTALHEIGHTLGLHHEHQSGNSGIVWDEEAVYRALEQPPNRWSREMTFENIIKKISSAEANGSTWDPDSIMEYPFEAGLILQPEGFKNGVFPPGTLSPQDIAWALKFYPGTPHMAPIALIPSQSINIAAQKEEQQDFCFTPTETRYYDLGTFGKTDNVMVLFEKGPNDELTYISGDDNASLDRGSNIRTKMFRGKEYVVKLRMYYRPDNEKASIMIW